MGWIKESPVAALCTMATDLTDQEMVARLADTDDRVIPAFGASLLTGFHPWAVHTISLARVSRDEHYRTLFGAPEHPDAQRAIELLPDPVALDDALAQLRSFLGRYPRALVGEVGVDRSFRLPAPPGSSMRFVPLQTPIEHQLAVLEAQLAIADEYSRSVSMHSVRAAGHTLSLLDNIYARGNTQSGSCALTRYCAAQLHPEPREHRAGPATAP